VQELDMILTAYNKWGLHDSTADKLTKQARITAA
jgi:hypothetical protein